MVDKNEPPAGMDLNCGLKNLGLDGTCYMGGVNNGLGLGKLQVNLILRHDNWIDIYSDTWLEKKLDKMDDANDDFEIVEV